MAHSHDIYAELFAMLGNRSERDAMALLRRIRSGHRPDAVLRYMKMGDVKSVLPDPRQNALEALLVNLAHSTASLRDIVRIATLTMDSDKPVRLPNTDDFLVLRNRIVNLHYLETLLQRPERLANTKTPERLTGPSDGDDQSDPSAQNPDSDKEGGHVHRHDHPTHQVPAAPWTSITTSDEAVSHLVSLFLAWINPTWRFVEEDLFLLGEFAAVRLAKS